MNDLLDLERVASKIRDHLEENKAPITLRNVVQAMFETSYADWIGGDEIYPQCEYETEANGICLTPVLIVEVTMKVIMNLVRRVRLQILATRIRLLNISIAIAGTRQITLGLRCQHLILRSTALGKRYRDLEGTAE